MFNSSIFLPLLVVGFLFLLIPAYGIIYNGIVNLFAYVMCKEIINKKSLTKADERIALVQLAAPKYKLLQFLVLRKPPTVQKIIQLFNAGEFRTQTALEITIGGNGFSSYYLTLKNILEKSPGSFDDIEAMIIAQANRRPEMIMDFAMTIKKLPFSKKKLFVEVSKLDAETKNKFAKKFANDPEIKKLTSLL